MAKISELLHVIDSRLPDTSNGKIIGRNAYIDTYRLYDPTTRYMCNDPEIYTNEIYVGIRQLIRDKIPFILTEIQTDFGDFP